MSIRSNRSATRPTLGLLVLDDPKYEQDEYHYTSTDQLGADRRPPGFLGNPRTWAFDLIIRVARGCSAVESALATDLARQGMRRAAEALGDRVDVITTNCAYTWFFRNAFETAIAPVIPSSLALLDVASRAGGPVAIVVSHTPNFQRLIGEVPSGSRIVPLEDFHEWHRFHEGLESEQEPLSQQRMANELCEAIDVDFAQNGGAKSIVLECTGLPQFRQMINQRHGVPVYDLVGFIHGLFGIDTPVLHEFPT